MPYLSPTQPLTLPLLAELLRHDEPVRLSPEAEQRIEVGYAYLQRRQALPPPAAGSVYGRPPDAGLLPEAQARWQSNLLMSHAAGAQPEVPTALVRRMLLLKAFTLSQGHHGVGLPTVRRLLDFYNREVWPLVLEQGSLGAYGDQAPLAHLCLPLLGLGQVSYQGYQLAAADVLELLGWAPLTLHAHEGLSLLSGNQFMLAYATEAQERAQHLLQAATAIAALSADVCGVGSVDNWPEVAHRAGRHAGPQQVATQLRALLAGSTLPHRPWVEASPVAWSLRGMPQVHGTSLDALVHTGATIETECNAVGGSSLVFPTEDLWLLEGSPVGQPLPLALDYLALAVTSVGGLSVARLGQLLSGRYQLPPALVAGGADLNFGLMALAHTAASLESQSKQLCAASSIIESGINPYGPLTAGSTAAIKARRVVENIEQLLGIELLAATQALDFRRPASSSPALETIAVAFRERVTFVAHDRVLAPDLLAAARFVREYAWP